MSCSSNRCNMTAGGPNSVIPAAQHTPYPVGATSASHAAQINGNANSENQVVLGNAFKGGKGGAGGIVVPQHQEIGTNQSGNMSANNTTKIVAASLSQGNANASMDKLVGGRMRRSHRKRARKSRKSGSKKTKRRKRRTQKHRISMRKGINLMRKRCA